MKKGTVKFYNSAKGFGFIKVDETNEEIFVHKSEIRGMIQENDIVEFEVKKDFPSEGGQFFNYAGTCRDKKFKAYFINTRKFACARNHIKRQGLIGKIKCYDNPVF